MIKSRQAGVVFSIFVFFLLTGTLRAQTGFYWEQPEIFSPAAGSFPVSAFNENLSLVAWQETEAEPASRSGGGGDGHITVSLAVKPSGGEWRVYRSVGGPYSYSGTEPSILSAAVDRDNRIFLAAAVSANETEILISDDRGESFSRVRVDSGSESSIAPRLYPRADGGYLIFITRGQEQSLSIYYARSDDGFTWSDFQPFVSDSSLQLNFLPTHSFLNGTDYVIFQSFLGGAGVTPSLQLVLGSSPGGGPSWTL
ncbi:MAG: glycoside hydrolase, partial [Spirochaetaceae bacterium]|nr:glycoside hydrolase [Spirochaetaceae bacterium]